MTVGQMRKLIEDADDEGPVKFYLGDAASPMEAHEWYATSTKDAVYIEFMPPDNWTRT